MLVTFLCEPYQWADHEGVEKGEVIDVQLTMFPNLVSDLMREGKDREREIIPLEEARVKPRLVQVFPRSHFYGFIGHVLDVQRYEKLDHYFNILIDCGVPIRLWGWGTAKGVASLKKWKVLGGYGLLEGIISFDSSMFIRKPVRGRAVEIGEVTMKIEEMKETRMRPYHLITLDISVGLPEPKHSILWH